MSRLWIAALRPVPGSLRLVLARWLLLVVSALPGLLAGLAGIGDAVARRPWFADAPDPLPVVHAATLLGTVPGAAWAALAAGAGLAWLGSLLLTAAAVAILDARRGGRVRVWRAVFDTGTRFLWLYLRVALLAVALLAAGAVALRLVFAALGDHGTAAGWSQQTLLLTLPLTHAALFFAWAATVGALAWWCRVIAVADGRRFARRLPGLALRVWRRRPLQGLLFHVALAAAALLLGAAVLYAWRQSASGTAGWALVWLAVLLLQSVAWHWRLRACRLLWAAPDFDAACATPDAPLGVARRLRRRLGRAATSPATGGS